MTSRPFLSDTEKAEWEIFFKKLHLLFCVVIVGIQIYAAGMFFYSVIEFLFSW